MSDPEDRQHFTLKLNLKTIWVLKKQAYRQGLTLSEQINQILDRWAAVQGGPPEKPHSWAAIPEKFLGEDKLRRHYWLLKDHVYRTTDTLDPKKCSTTLVCSIDEFESGVREREGVV